jgi:hypothetical protein
MGRPPRGRFPLGGTAAPFHSLDHNDENIPLFLHEQATEGFPGEGGLRSGGSPARTGSLPG